MFKRKRRVRLQLKPGVGPDAVEGIMAGRRAVAGSYILEMPKVLTGRDGGNVEEFTLDIHALEVPAENVALVEVHTR